MADVNVPENEAYLGDVTHDLPPPLANGMCTSAVLEASFGVVAFGTVQRS